MELPQEGIGSYHFHGQTEEPNEDNWGTLKLVKVLEQVGREWNQSHPEGPRIGTGDMSLKYGGQFCWWRIGLHWPPIQRQCHERHQQGLNADMRYVRSDGEERGFVFVGSGPFAEYDQTLTQELICILCEAGVTLIYADTRADLDTDGYSGCNISDFPGHHNHIHIKIAK